MAKVALRISGLADVSSSTSRKRLAFAHIEAGDLIVESGLGADALLNDHLIAIWGHIKHERRYLKSLQQDGATFQVSVTAEDSPICLKPNGAEMLHLLGVTLVIGGA